MAVRTTQISRRTLVNGRNPNTRVSQIARRTLVADYSAAPVSSIEAIGGLPIASIGLVGGIAIADVKSVGFVNNA